MKYILSYIFYTLGNFTYLVCDKLADFKYIPFFLIDLLWFVYNKFMNWSVALDENESIWKTIKSNNLPE